MKESFEENFLTAVLPGGIEAQEKRGQSWLQTAGVLPKEAPWPQLEALGFVRGEDYDELFVRVTMPEGWAIEETDHNMHSRLRDAEGRERGGIFYKAAFYDRCADMHLSRRYREDCEYGEGYSTTTPFVTDAITGERLYTGATTTRPPKGASQEEVASYFDAREVANKSCTDWLGEHFPDHMNPLAYWNPA